AAVARPTIPPSSRISFSTSASVRGFIARKLNGCSSNLATVSCLNGTDPITSVGLSVRMSSIASIRQQSPSFGKPPTGATSAHHFVTPTSPFFAPIAYRIEVALGASETIRSSFFRGLFFMSTREYQTQSRLKCKHQAAALTPLRQYV